MNNIPGTRIHKNAIKAWRVTALVYGLLWFAPSLIYVAVSAGKSLDSGLQWFESVNWILFGGITFCALVLFCITCLLLPNLRWKRWRYDVTEKEIDMMRGIVIVKRTMVPINRVQHVDTRQGPIYRNFGLSSVAISTAATTHEIPALDDGVAEELRDKISTLVRKVKEDV